MHSKPEPPEYEDIWFYYDVEFVRRVYFEKRNAQGHFTLTGSWLQDREEFPGLFDHDVPLYGQLFAVADHDTEELLKEEKESA